MKKVVLGLSGGVDSAVCARLLQKEGFEVLGLYLDIGDENAKNDAIKTAQFLGVSLKIEDVAQRLEENVCSKFLECYLRGETPNPCIICNPSVKFERLLAYADKCGAEHIATGHYAIAENGAIYKAQSSNDQSYMLCRLTRAQAARLLLPLGKFEKSEVRAMAEEFNIPVASKPDSMEICFIPDKDYIGWISRRAEVPKEGNFVFNGEVIGKHEGIHRWTVGQRRPGLFNERKLYISKINPDTNEIELCLWEDLFKTEVRARDVSWLIDIPDEPIRGSVKVRHTKWENPECTISATADGGMVVVTDEAVRAPAPGQAAVIYCGERLIGGGFII